MPTLSRGHHVVTMMSCWLANRAGWALGRCSECNKYLGSALTWGVTYGPHSEHRTKEPTNSSKKEQTCGWLRGRTLGASPTSGHRGEGEAVTTSTTYALMLGALIDCLVYIAPHRNIHLLLTEGWCALFFWCTTSVPMYPAPGKHLPSVCSSVPRLSSSLQASPTSPSPPPPTFRVYVSIRVSIVHTDYCPAHSHI
jgi:hypothetical protein